MLRLGSCKTKYYYYDFETDNDNNMNDWEIYFKNEKKKREQIMWKNRKRKEKCCRGFTNGFSKR